MKKYLFYILLFFLLVAVVDVTFGKAMDYYMDHLKGGQYYNLQYAMKETNADILIFGSSRAINHYVPKVIEDSLGMTCYNCGFHAQGIIYQYGRLRYIINRYKPKMVIYDIEYHFDFGKGENEVYLDMLKPYCSDTCIANYFKEYSWKEYFKNKSYLYRYNTNFVKLINDFRMTRMDSEKGFEPLDKTINYEIEKKEIGKVEIDSLKLLYLKKFYMTCKNNSIPIVMFVSPRYDAISSKVHEPIRSFCEENNIPYFDYFASPYYQEHKELFANSKHLNVKGAYLYTKHIIRNIRPSIIDSLHYNCTNR